MESIDGWSGEATRFHPPRLKLLLMALASAFFAFLGAVAIGSGFPLVVGIGWLVLIGFVLGTLVLLVRALRPGPTVVLDRLGIIDRTALLPTGQIRWEQIAVVRKREIGRGWGSERMLEMGLADPDWLRDRPRSRARRLVDAYRRFVKQPDVFIPGSMVNVSMQRVIDEIRRWRPGLEILELPPPRPKLLRRRQAPTLRRPRW